MLRDMTPVDKTNLVFDMVRRMRTSDKCVWRGSKPSAAQWVFLGHCVCFKAFLILTQSSKTFLNRLIEAIDAGAVVAPQDGRKTREKREAPQMASADTFFSNMWSFLGESLAETALPDPDSEENFFEGVSEADFDALTRERGAKDVYNEFVLGDANPSIAAAMPPNEREVRWIPHTNIAQMYEQYKFQHSSDSEPLCSMSVFYRCWKTRWCGVIRIRRASQHAQCETCAKYAQWRLRARSEQEKGETQAAYSKHLSQVFADRDLSARYNTHSEQSCSEQTQIPFSKRTLMLSLDGMDQAEVSLATTVLKFILRACQPQVNVICSVRVWCCFP